LVNDDVQFCFLGTIISAFMFSHFVYLTSTSLYCTSICQDFSFVWLFNVKKDKKVINIVKVTRYKKALFLYDNEFEAIF
jgi:hypothetical protein